jgi:Zn-dependent protease with chaperone function
MFFARGVAVSFSVFAIIYCSLSLAVSCAWRRVWASIHQQSSRAATDLLFGLRIFPLVAATVVTTAFAIPSFLLLEPRQIEESLGWMPLVLAICGAGLGIFGTVNAMVALLRASRMIAAWSSGAQQISSDIAAPVLRVVPAAPAMTATGIVRPRILVSAAAESLLTRGELSAALNHEMAHVRRQDNLRKLILRFVAFPGMRALEMAWLEAAEIAADDAAVYNADEALELASALIKLSRSNQAPPEVDLTAALVHSPASMMNLRIERLVAWEEGMHLPPRAFSWRSFGVAVATLVLLAATYSQVLVGVHAATEWLVR